MDPLSTTASVVAITTAALQSAQFLAKAIDNVKDAPNTIKDINADLRAVEPVLQNLTTALQKNPSQLILSDQIKNAVKNYDEACVAFQSQIKHWTRHSTEEKTFWTDRWKIGLFGQERIKTFKGQLSDCKGTLTVALSTATMYLFPHYQYASISLICHHSIMTSYQENLMKEMKDMILQQNEVVLRRKIAKTSSEKTEIERGLQQMSIDGSTEQNNETDQSRLELFQEIQRQQASNNVFRTMCEEALQSTVYERTGQKIKGIKATNDSSALAGFINTSGEELRIGQDISDVTADQRSIAVAGVVKGFNFKDLRSG
jgi:Fungal N-terminal domain of STAND proteins